MRRHLLIVTLFAALACASALAADGPVKEAEADMPPYVVKTNPPNRARDVDYRLREIKVTFDRPRRTQRSWSWVIHRRIGWYPGRRGAPPRWENGGRTCVLPVQLRPDTLYAVGCNSPRLDGFRDPDGRVAVPYAWVFRTKKAEGEK